jgi:hypothetical protein
MCSVIRSLRQAMNACFECLRSTRNTGYDGYDLRSIRCSCVRFSSFQRQAMLWEQLRMAQSRDTMKRLKSRIVGEDAERVIVYIYMILYMLLLLCLPFPRFPVSCLLPQRTCPWQIAVRSWPLQIREIRFTLRRNATKIWPEKGTDPESLSDLSATASHCESQAMKRIQLETELVWGPSRKVGRLALN